ncbi:hypothetical protein XELAEV_18023206mg [Xenopus laevis]|uniref:Uncharacterized protein n=1 Tax=Xenopus laevis TaxID=8355 RepID=A0A974D3S5_XENLA|nr:hypothetical protein XELAEV_18023206mg [Xenopus laevis]
MNISVMLTPAMTLLHIFPADLERGEEFIIHHMMFAARASIARMWKASTAPTMHQVLKDAQYSMSMEELMDCDIKRATQNTAIWRVWRRTQLLDLCRQTLSTQGSTVPAT